MSPLFTHPDSFRMGQFEHKWKASEWIRQAAYKPTLLPCWCKPLENRRHYKCRLFPLKANDSRFQVAALTTHLLPASCLPSKAKNSNWLYKVQLVSVLWCKQSKHLAVVFGLCSAVLMLVNNRSLIHLVTHGWKVRMDKLNRGCSHLEVDGSL